MSRYYFDHHPYPPPRRASRRREYSRPTLWGKIFSFAIGVFAAIGIIVTALVLVALMFR